MKTFLFSVVLCIVTTACSHRAQHAAYDIIHERERQECLKLGQRDCPRTENYEQYKKQRDEVLQIEKTEEAKQIIME